MRNPLVGKPTPSVTNSFFARAKAAFSPRNTVFAGVAAAAIAMGYVPVLLALKLGADGPWLAGIIYSVAVFIAIATAIWVVRAPSVDQQMSPGAANRLVENLGDAVLRYNRAGDLVFVSSSAKDLFGCQKFELSGAGLADRIHVLDKPLCLTTLSEARCDGKKREISVRLRRDSAEPGQVAPEFFWAKVNFAPVNNGPADTGPFELVLLFVDVSEQKDNEARILAAQADAESATQAKSQFLATVGHELRTPLNAIVGFADMMSSGIGGDLTPTHEEYAGLIKQSSHHLLEVVNSLLDMSRIEAGKFELNTASFEPSELVAPCLQVISKVAREKNVDIEVKLGNFVPNIVADERACRQIMINLLSNAVKFSNPGGSVIWSIKQQGHFLKLMVADNGIGMSAEYIKQLGEPFSQAQTGADRNYEGTGLGFSIVKGLAELHDGKLGVTSELGRGTTISVLLPINGPETKLDDNAPVTEIHSGKTQQSDDGQWPEQKRIAR